MRSVVANLNINHGARTCSRKFQFIYCLQTAKYHYLFEGHKVFEYQTKTDLLNGPGT